MSIEVGDNGSAIRRAKIEVKKVESSISYSQVFSIPVGVDAAKAGAEFEYGVLSITFPKAEVLKPSKIEVK